ncbi:hypothetical protein PR003_g14462 [Phytophthora rubi]|uniref:Uncharacterized protein n=1 Tax=Phytophthora rubi TaxID=129364 RepID=A0A6A4EUJ6_9STRA|nr:hypothetical protein PR003_g14462 [Phytophthora rubi]
MPNSLPKSPRNRVVDLTRGPCQPTELGVQVYGSTRRPSSDAANSEDIATHGQWGGHCPPDPAKADRSHLVQGGSSSIKSDAIPPIFQGKRGGPHQVGTPQPAGMEPFPAFVTTPSDYKAGRDPS